MRVLFTSIANLVLVVNCAIGASGPFLASLFATSEADYAAAAHFNLQIIKEGRGSPQIFHDTTVYLIVSGEISSAIELAHEAEKKNLVSPAMAMVLILDKIKKKQHQPLIDILKKYEDEVPSIVSKLLKGWSLIDVGMFSEGLEEIKSISGNKFENQISTFYQAMAFADRGDFDSASRLLKDGIVSNLVSSRNTLSLLATSQILAKSGHINIAKEILNQNLLEGNSYGPITLFLKVLDQDQVFNFDAYNGIESLIADSINLMAELTPEGNHSSISEIFYTQIAAEIDPKANHYYLNLGNLHAEVKNYELAVRFFNKVKRHSPLHFDSRLALAKTLSSTGSGSGSIEVLETLISEGYNHFDVFELLGDELRATGSYDLAENAYSEAINLHGELQPEKIWATYFLRGITREQSGKWDQAIEDLNLALSFKPEHPDILNYLGYMLIERNKNLESALAMIELALNKRPQSGYIADSLAWGLYRLGRFEEALAPMETAVRLEPTDPIVNDHFGDILWVVDRKREANFQWRRALLFDADNSLSTRINKKLKFGLDKVLDQEKADGQ